MITLLDDSILVIYFWFLDFLGRLEILFEIKTCEKFYCWPRDSIGVGAYAQRVLTSEDKILSIPQGSDKRTIFRDSL
jgi:hypothetical protein